MAERQSLDLPPPTCCTQPILQEIWKLREKALQATVRALKTLADPDEVEDALEDHFRVRPNDKARLATIRRRITEMAEAMTASDVLFYCRDEGDPTCARRRAAAENCSSTQPRRLWLCGSIALGPPFLWGKGWLKTLIHEYAHIGCRELGGMLSDGKEFYSGRKGYPPESDLAVKNADSYANFVLEVQ